MRRFEAPKDCLPKESDNQLWVVHLLDSVSAQKAKEQVQKMGGALLRKSICFISRYAYFALTNGTRTKIGGAEFQQAIIARALRNQGWDVSFITEDFTKGKQVVIGGIRILGGLNYNIGSRFTRRFWHLPKQLWKLMYVSGASIFYIRNPGPLVSYIALCSRFIRKKLVIAGASDSNFDKKKGLNSNSIIDNFDIKIGIRLSNLLIVQNQLQKSLLKRNYSKTSQIFYNIYDPPASFRLAILEPFKKTKPRILWIGRLSSEKRPELCIELAQKLPEFEIVIIGAIERSSNRQPGIDVKKASTSVPNLFFYGHMPVEAVELQLDSAQALINTSRVEGFPNTFLQAWSRGIPVFTFVDPDNIIHKNSLGCAVKSLEEMACKIRNTLNDATTFNKNSIHIRKFFIENFSVSKKIHILENILLDSP